MENVFKCLEKQRGKIWQQTYSKLKEIKCKGQINDIFHLKKKTTEKVHREIIQKHFSKCRTKLK